MTQPAADSFADATASVRPLVPVHPEAVCDDAQALRWVFAPGTLDLVAVPTTVPAALQRLLDDGTLIRVSVESIAVRTTLGSGLAWREHGDRVRIAVQEALATPDQWRAADGQSPDDVLRAAVTEVLDGQVGRYIQSHGGSVELLDVKDGVVEVKLSGACSHCPASGITLNDRLESGIRALYPGLRGLRACHDLGISSGRRMLGLLRVR